MANKTDKLSNYDKDALMSALRSVRKEKLSTSLRRHAEKLLNKLIKNG